MTGYHDLIRISAGMGIFLIGVNLAFLLNLGTELVRWFTVKIMAVTTLLVYVVLSMTYGNPAVWRAWIGLIAMVIDCAAVFWMWWSVTRATESGHVGLVPLLRSIEEDD